MKAKKQLMSFVIAVGVAACSTGETPKDIPAKLLSESEVTERKEDTAYVGFKLEGTELTIELTLTAADSWIVSPLEGEFQYGGCSIELHRSEHLEFEGELLELPESVEVYDEVLERSVRRNQVSTTFKRSLRILTVQDFEARGSIFFVLEPKCVPYQCFFVIKQERGELSIRSDEVIDLR